MVRPLVIVCLAFLQVGCASTYDFAGRTVINTGGERRNYSPVGAKGFATQDSNLTVQYTPDIVDAGVAFVFQNRSAEEPIEIIWDETMYLGPGGMAERVFHADVKVKDRGEPQRPTFVPPQTALRDDVVPVSKVEWQDLGTYGARWNYLPLCGRKDVFSQRLEDDECIGQVFGYYFTYRIGGQKKHLTVKFRYDRKATEYAKEPARRNWAAPQ